MSKEYDATSRPSNSNYRDNYDRIFRKAKAKRDVRSQARQVLEELEAEAQAQGVPTKQGLR